MKGEKERGRNFWLRYRCKIHDGTRRGIWRWRDNGANRLFSRCMYTTNSCRYTGHRRRTLPRRSILPEPNIVTFLIHKHPHRYLSIYLSRTIYQSRNTVASSVCAALCSGMTSEDFLLHFSLSTAAFPPEHPRAGVFSGHSMTLMRGEKEEGAFVSYRFEEEGLEVISTEEVSLSPPPPLLCCPPPATRACRSGAPG